MDLASLVSQHDEDGRALAGRRLAGYLVGGHGLPSHGWTANSSLQAHRDFDGLSTAADHAAEYAEVASRTCELHKLRLADREPALRASCCLSWCRPATHTDPLWPPGVVLKAKRLDHSKGGLREAAVNEVLQASAVRHALAVFLGHDEIIVSRNHYLVMRFRAYPMVS